MQIGSLNSTVPAPGTGTGSEDAPGSRAEEFARVLRTAFFGNASAAGSRATDRIAAPAATASTSVRSDAQPRNADSRPDSRPADSSRADTAPRGNDSRPADRTAPSRETASRPADRPENRPAERPAERPSGRDAAAPQAGSDKTAAPAAIPAAGPADVPADPAATDQPAEDARTAESAAAIAVPGIDVILALLQQMGLAAQAAGQAGDAAAAAAPAAAGAAAAATVVVTDADRAAALDLLAAMQMAGRPAMTGPDGKPLTPEELAQMLAAARQAAAEAGRAAGQPAATLPEMLAAAAGKPDTAIAALLAQHAALSEQDHAAIRQALAAQAAAAGLPGEQAAVQPQLAAAVQPAAKQPVVAQGDLQVEVKAEAAAPAAPRSLLDQSSLLAGQQNGGDRRPAGDAALPPAAHDAQAADGQPLPAAAQPDAKFAALLQPQAKGADGLVPQAAAAAQFAVGPSAAGQPGASPAHIAQSAAAVPGTQPGLTAPQAAQQAAAQNTARNLAAFVPPGEQVAVQIRRAASEGMDKISIRLDPGNLGKVEVRMEVGHDGRLTAVIAADKPETLQMLQRDAQQLEQSLRDAGLKTASDSLNFTLRDQGQAADGRDGRGGQGSQGRGFQRGQDGYAEGSATADAAQLAAARIQQAAAARGGLDIRI
ncbi:flagellar hook-length control protein FliK [Ferrovibrio sp.]|uniref:flagellar hook-length control protein FliK n=1 Tax=Ferrovibrio sp. TaxID=1917215 RepID=UPI00351996A4